MSVRGVLVSDWFPLPALLPWWAKVPIITTSRVAVKLVILSKGGGGGGGGGGG